MIYHTICPDMDFPQYVRPYIFANGYFYEMTEHNGNNDLVSLHYVLADNSPNNNFLVMIDYTDYT